MWLTLTFPDLCNCTCIYTAPPPLAAAHPLTSLCNSLHNAMSWRGEAANNESVHQFIKDVNKFSDLVVLDNCYAISCHALA